MNRPAGCALVTGIGTYIAARRVASALPVDERETALATLRELGLERLPPPATAQ